MAGTVEDGPLGVRQFLQFLIGFADLRLGLFDLHVKLDLAAAVFQFARLQRRGAAVDLGDGALDLPADAGNGAVHELDLLLHGVVQQLVLRQFAVFQIGRLRIPVVTVLDLADALVQGLHLRLFLQLFVALDQPPVDAGLRLQLREFRLDLRQPLADFFLPGCQFIDQSLRFADCFFRFLTGFFRLLVAGSACAGLAHLLVAGLARLLVAGSFGFLGSC